MHCECTAAHSHDAPARCERVPAQSHGLTTHSQCTGVRSHDAPTHSQCTVVHMHGATTHWQCTVVHIDGLTMQSHRAPAHCQGVGASSENKSTRRSYGPRSRHLNGMRQRRLEKENKVTIMKTQSNRKSKSAHKLAPVGGASPLPMSGAPTPPADGKPRARGTRYLRPQKAQVDAGLDAARELRASKGFANIIGPGLAVPHELADAIEFAVGWNREAKASRAWQLHANTQSVLAWDYVLGVLEKLRAPLLAGQGSDSALEKEFHAFTRLITARSDSANRAVATRRAKKREKEKPAKPETAVVAVPATIKMEVSGATVTNGANGAAKPASASG